jgi:hypothetical protein
MHALVIHMMKFQTDATMQCKNAITISKVQNACLEHAEVLGALQNFENLSSLHFLFSKIFKLPHKARIVPKIVSNIFEINTKINLTKNEK